MPTSRLMWGTNVVITANGVRIAGSASCDPAVGVQLVGDTVQHEQLTVEGIERPEPEVAVREQLADGHLAVVDTVERARSSR